MSLSQLVITFLLWMLAQGFMFLGKDSGISQRRKQKASLISMQQKYFNVAHHFFSPFKSKHHFFDYFFDNFDKYACIIKLS